MYSVGYVIIPSRPPAIIPAVNDTIGGTFSGLVMKFSEILKKTKHAENKIK
jgi:hypothetical protein